MKKSNKLRSPSQKDSNLRRAVTADDLIFYILPGGEEANPYLSFYDGT